MARPAPDLETLATDVPGLVGDVIEWIVDSAQIPNRVLALGTALSVIGTLIGRHIAGPTESGTHLYVIGLGKTACGKQHVIDTGKKLLHAAGAESCIGPGAFVSGAALISTLKHRPLSIYFQDEFGAYLGRINSKKAGNHEKQVSSDMRMSWGCSFNRYDSCHAVSNPSATIHAPAMSIVGLSTFEEFYESVRGADLSNGFINRFVVLSSDNRAPSQEPEHELRAVPEDIAAKAKELYERRSVRGNLAMMHDADVPVEPEIHGWADGAARLLYNSFTSYVHKRIDKEPGFEAFAGRWPENAVRIATIRAAGHGWPDFTITYDDMLWAINVVRACGERLIDQAGTHRVEEELSHPAAHAKIVQILKEAGGNMTRSALLRKVQRQVKSKDLDGIIKQLAESETIIAVPRSGISPACYKLAGNA